MDQPTKKKPEITLKIRKGRRYIRRICITGSPISLKESGKKLIQVNNMEQRQGKREVDPKRPLKRSK